MHGGVKKTLNFERNSGLLDNEVFYEGFYAAVLHVSSLMDECTMYHGPLRYHTFEFKSHFLLPTLELITLDLCISRAHNPRHGLHVVLQEHFTCIWFWICQQRRSSGVLGGLQSGEVYLERLCPTIVKHSYLPPRSFERIQDSGIRTIEGLSGVSI